MRPLFRLGITQILPWCFRSGDLRGAWSEPVLALEGIAAHQRIQRQWPAERERERTVTGSWSEPEFELQLRGRVDGLLARDDVLHLIEIKTLRQTPADLPAAQLQTFWLQLELYAALWLREQPDTPCNRVQLELCCVHPDTRKSESLTRWLDRGQITTIGEQHFALLLATLSDLVTHRQARDQRLQALDFPLPTFRAGQRDMAAEVYRTLRDAGQCLIEAPTGSGKTLAALFPALKAMGQGLIDQVQFASMRNEGQRSALEALEKILAPPSEAAPGALRVLQLQGKERLCPAEEACVRNDCPRQRGFHDRLPAARAQALRQGWLSTERLLALAERHQLCPQGLQIALWPWVDVVVADCNYAFAPGNRVDFPFQLNRVAVLADEAHNLPERARLMFSAELPEAPFVAVAQTLDSPGHPLSAPTWALLQACRETPPEAMTAVLTGLQPALQVFRDAAQNWLLHPPELFDRRTDLSLIVQTALRRVLDWMALADEAQADFACFPRPSSDPGWQLVCLSPARLLQRSYRALTGLVLFSATLSPPDFFATRLGLSPKLRRLRLPSPFEPRHQATLIHTGLSLRWRDRERHLDALCDLLATVMHTHPGHYWVFVPAFAFLEALHTRFLQRHPSVRCVRQSRETTNAARAAFLDAFRQPDGKGCLGLTVLGSVFTESVDLPGDQLIGVIVLSAGLPQPDPTQEAIAHYHEEQGLDGRRMAYQLPGWQRVLQAAGRVIRGPEDRGVVVLVDDRFGEPAYRALLPPHWQPQWVRNTPALEVALTRFWEAQVAAEAD